MAVRQQADATPNNRQLLSSPRLPINGIFIIDDEPNSALALGIMLYEHGYKVKVEKDSARAREAVREFQPSVVLIDFMMPKAPDGEVAWPLHADPALKDTQTDSL